MYTGMLSRSLTLRGSKRTIGTVREANGGAGMSTRFAPWSPSTQRTHPCGQLDLKPLFPLWHGFRVAVCIGARHPDDPMPDSALIAAQTMLFVASSRVQQYVNLNYPVWGGAGAETGTGALDRPSESISQAAAASDASRRRAPVLLSPIQFNIAESRASRLNQPCAQRPAAIGTGRNFSRVTSAQGHGCHFIPGI